MRDQVVAINERLKAACVPVRVLLRGNSLILRATLPNKNGRGNKQQDISPRLRASQDGLKRIEREAHRLGGLMAMGQFSWSLYQKPVDQSEKLTASELIAKFKADYLKAHMVKESTWQNTWHSTFKRLPQDEPLSEALLLG